MILVLYPKIKFNNKSKYHAQIKFELTSENVQVWYKAYKEIVYANSIKMLDFQFSVRAVGTMYVSNST